MIPTSTGMGKTNMKRGAFCWRTYTYRIGKSKNRLNPKTKHAEGVHGAFQCKKIGRGCAGHGMYWEGAHNGFTEG